MPARRILARRVRPGPHVTGDIASPVAARPRLRQERPAGTTEPPRAGAGPMEPSLKRTRDEEQGQEISVEELARLMQGAKIQRVDQP